MKAKSYKKVISSLVIAMVLLFSIGTITAIAYSRPVETCSVSDCTAPIWGTIIPNTSSFPRASSTSHQRVANYLFICDNCGNTWTDTITTSEAHEFVNRRCECGYYAY